MKKRLIISAAVVGVAVTVALVVAVAGGGGGEKALAIRTQRGLAVANSPGAPVQGPAAELALGKGAAGGALPAAGIGGVGGDAAVTGQLRLYQGGGGLSVVSVPQLAQAGGITVQGYGSASAAADGAVVEFSFSSSGTYGKPIPFPFGGQEESAEPSPSPAPRITEEALKPVIDAIVAAGVGRGDIEFLGQPYPDPYFSSATLRAKVNDIGSLDSVVQAAQQAAEGLQEISLTNTSVSYTVSDCLALEKEALKAAVADADERGGIFAQTLGVGLGAVVAASDYSYAPYGGGCGQSYIGIPYPMGGMPYVEGQASQVQIFANVSITYAIQ